VKKNTTKNRALKAAHDAALDKYEVANAAADAARKAYYAAIAASNAAWVAHCKASEAFREGSAK